MAKRSPGTGSAKPLATAFAGVPFSKTSRSPRSSTAAPMSLKDCRTDGMPPWWSLTPLRSRTPLRNPIRCSFPARLAGLPAVDEGGGGGVGVVLDRDRLALGDALHLGGEHRLLDGGLVGVAVRRLDRHVELHLLAAAHLRLAARPDVVDHTGRLDAGLSELLRHLGVCGLTGHVAAHPGHAVRRLRATHRFLGLRAGVLHLLEEPHPGLPSVECESRSTLCPHRPEGKEPGATSPS